MVIMGQREICYCTWPSIQVTRNFSIPGVVFTKLLISLSLSEANSLILSSTLLLVFKIVIIVKLEMNDGHIHFQFHYNFQLCRIGTQRFSNSVVPSEFLFVCFMAIVWSY